MQSVHTYQANTVCLLAWVLTDFHLYSPFLYVKIPKLQNIKSYFYKQVQWSRVFKSLYNVIAKKTFYKTNSMSIEYCKGLYDQTLATSLHTLCSCWQEAEKQTLQGITHLPFASQYRGWAPRCWRACRSGCTRGPGWTRACRESFSCALTSAASVGKSIRNLNQVKQSW